MKRTTRIVVAFSLALPIVANVFTGTSTALPAPNERHVMVVTFNATETWSSSDNADDSDMQAFVRRLKSNMMDGNLYWPDIILLQEVRASTATNIKNLLNKASEDSGETNYIFARKPKANSFVNLPGSRAGASDTGILVNGKTMRVVHTGGFIKTPADPADINEPYDPIFFQAYALVKRKGTDKLFPTMSIHFNPRAHFDNDSTDHEWRRKWVTKVHNFIRNKYDGRTGPKTLIVGGDFNQKSCLRGTSADCSVVAPFHKKMQGDFGYRNSLGLHGPVDYIFSKRMPTAAAGHDEGYDSLRRKYSDHEFRWAYLGPDDVPPQKPKGFSVENGGPCRLCAYVRWDEAFDQSGSGVDHYELERVKLDGEKGAPVGPWETVTDDDDKPRYEVDHVSGVGWWQYRVRSVDKAGNVSPWVKDKAFIQAD